MESPPKTRQEEDNYFASIEMAPADAILKLSQGFAADTDPRKVNLGVGAYRDNNGKPYVFPVVKKAESLIQQATENGSMNKEYSTIVGDQTFNRGARGVLFGWDHQDVTSGRVCTSQTLSGTGALRIIGEFLSKFAPAPVYVSDPSWGNHFAIFGKCGLETKKYRYYNKATNGFDFEGMCEDLKQAPAGSHILLHTCAHNPTGADPTMEQWMAIAEICKEQKLKPFFDTAYQGFVTGDLDKDGASVRYFLS